MNRQRKTPIFSKSAWSEDEDEDEAEAEAEVAAKGRLVLKRERGGGSGAQVTCKPTKKRQREEGRRDTLAVSPVSEQHVVAARLRELEAAGGAPLHEAVTAAMWEACKEGCVLPLAGPDRRRHLTDLHEAVLSKQGEAENLSAVGWRLLQEAQEAAAQGRHPEALTLRLAGVRTLQDYEVRLAEVQELDDKYRRVRSDNDFAARATALLLALGQPGTQARPGVQGHPCDVISLPYGPSTIRNAMADTGMQPDSRPVQSHRDDGGDGGAAAAGSTGAGAAGSGGIAGAAGGAAAGGAAGEAVAAGGCKASAPAIVEPSPGDESTDTEEDEEGAFEYVRFRLTGKPAAVRCLLGTAGPLQYGCTSPSCASLKFNTLAQAAVHVKTRHR